MRIEKFEISSVIYDAAHQISGLLVMEISDVHPLKLVIGPGSEVPHQIPRRFVRQIIAQESEQYPEQVKRQKNARKQPYPVHLFFSDTAAYKSRHLRQYFGCAQIDHGKKQRRQDRDHIQASVSYSLTAES